MKRILTLMAAGSLLATLATAQTPRYIVTDLGTLGGTVGSANGINYEGRVAGAATLANGNSRAFLPGPGGATLAPALKGDIAVRPAQCA